MPKRRALEQPERFRHWNYRVVRVETDYGPEWGIYEVYYDGDGRPVSRTEDPVPFTSDTGPSEVLDALAHALDGAATTALLDSEIGGHDD